MTQRTNFTRVLFTVRTSHSFRAHVYLLYCMYVHNSRTALPMAVFTISRLVNSNTCRLSPYRRSPSPTQKVEKRGEFSLTTLSILKYGFHCPDFHRTQDAQHRQAVICCTELQPLGSEMRKVSVEISLRSQAKHDTVSVLTRDNVMQRTPVLDVTII